MLGVLGAVVGGVVGGWSTVARCSSSLAGHGGWGAPGLARCLRVFAVARGGDGGPAPVREMARWLRCARQSPVAFPCPVSAGWVPFSPKGLAFLTAASDGPCGRRWGGLGCQGGGSGGGSP